MLRCPSGRIDQYESLPVDRRLYSRSIRAAACEFGAYPPRYAGREARRSAGGIASAAWQERAWRAQFSALMDVPSSFSPIV